MYYINIYAVGGFALVDPTNLGDYISLVGALLSPFLIFMFPSAIHLLVFACGREQTGSDMGKTLNGPVEGNADDGPSPRATPWQCAYGILWMGKDVVIFLFGIIVTGVGTYASIEDLISRFNEYSIPKDCLLTQ